MARGVLTPGATGHEAEQTVLDSGAAIRVLRSKLLDHGDLRAISPGGTFPPDAWVVVVEDDDPSQVKVAQQEDPRGRRKFSTQPTCWRRCASSV